MSIIPTVPADQQVVIDRTVPSAGTSRPAAAVIVIGTADACHRARLALDSLSASESAGWNGLPGGPAVCIDADRFDEVIRSLPSLTGDERRAALNEACVLADGPLLQDERYAEWVQGPRRHYDRLRLEVHVAAAEANLADGDAALALDCAEKAMLVDRTCEPAYHAAMRAAGLLGRRDMILGFFTQCERVLNADLGVPPMAATSALRDQLIDEGRVVGAGVGLSTWSPASERPSVDGRPWN